MLAFVMAVVMFFGMIALTPKAEAQTTNSDLVAMQAQITQLTQILNALLAQLAMMQGSLGSVDHGNHGNMMHDAHAGHDMSMQNADPTEPALRFISSKEVLLEQDDTSSGDKGGLFQLVFSITAGDEDIYLPDMPTYFDGPSDGSFVQFSLSKASRHLAYSKELNANHQVSLVSTAEDLGEFGGYVNGRPVYTHVYLVEAGETENFTLTVVFDPSDTDIASYRLHLEGPLKYSLDPIFFDGNDLSYSFKETGFVTDYLILPFHVTNTTKTATYKGYMNGSLFITSPNITEVEAVTNCGLNANNNPTRKVYCTWDGEIIFDNRTPTGATSAFWDVDDGTGIYVVGVYEGSYPSGVRHGYNFHPQGEVELVMNKQAGQFPDTMLVLTAYEPVKWKLTGDAASQVSRVFLSGYHDQEIVGIDSDVEVIHQTHKSGSNEYFYFYDKDSRDAAKLVDYIKNQTGGGSGTLYPYHGEYSSESVRLGWKG